MLWLLKIVAVGQFLIRQAKREPRDVIAVGLFIRDEVLSPDFPSTEMQEGREKYCKGAFHARVISSVAAPDQEKRKKIQH